MAWQDVSQPLISPFPSTHTQHVKVWDFSASTSFVAKVGASVHPAEIRALTVFPGTSHIAVGYMNNQECTEICVWDASQGGIVAGEASSSKATVPPLWSVAGHGDTITSLSVIGRNGLVSASYDRTVRVWLPAVASDPSPAADEASLVVHSGENVALAAAAWADGRGLVYGCDGTFMMVFPQRVSPWPFPPTYALPPHTCRWQSPHLGSETTAPGPQSPGQAFGWGQGAGHCPRRQSPRLCGGRQGGAPLARRRQGKRGPLIVS